MVWDPVGAQQGWGLRGEMGKDTHINMMQVQSTLLF